MSVYYYNGNRILAPFSIESNQPVFFDDTVSLKHVRSAQKAQRWELSFEVLSNDNIVESFLGSIDEISTAKTMIMPHFKEVDDKRTAVGNLFASGGTAGDTEISLVFSGFHSGILPKGSFISFANHSKVYITKTDIDFSLSNTTVDIYPALVKDLSVSSTTVYYGSACELTYYRDVSTATNIRYSDGILADMGKIKLIEAL
jgi:hypothetical protein